MTFGDRRKPMKRGKRVKAVSDRRRDENEERRRAAEAKWGRFPACQLCQPLRDHGIVTGCNGRADDLDEILRRSAGGSIVDMDNCRPVGRRCHRWLTEHPAEARAWGLERSRYEGQGDPES